MRKVREGNGAGEQVCVPFPLRTSRAREVMSPDPLPPIYAMPDTHSPYSRSACSAIPICNALYPRSTYSLSVALLLAYTEGVNMWY